MGLRPAKCYRNNGKKRKKVSKRPRVKRAFTRTAKRVHRRNYVGAAPGLKTRQWNMGHGSKNFSHIADLIVTDTLNIRDNALESARLIVNRYLVNKLGKDGFFMKIRIYPHHILRENKQAQGAHADRIQQGMSHSYGKSIGRAARVKAGQKIMSVLVDEPHIDVAKTALLRTTHRFPCSVSVKISTDVESIGTRPSKRKIMLEEKKVEAEVKAEEVKEEEMKEGEAKEETGKEEKGAEEKAGEKEGAEEKTGEGKEGAGSEGQKDAA